MSRPASRPQATEEPGELGAPIRDGSRDSKGAVGWTYFCFPPLSSLVWCPTSACRQMSVFFIEGILLRSVDEGRS